MAVPYIHDEITHNPEAASQVLPVLFDIYKPSSIVDVGCGLGNWIQVAKQMGITDVMGVDGSYVDRSLLKINEQEFVEKDLTQPFQLNRKFDLAISLEVAEHLPESSAASFIESITRHTDVVLFSAALPGQGGQNHINEQWPDYWQQHFKHFGFIMLDCIRPKIWKNKKIERWYRQNIFLAVKQGHPLAEGNNSDMLSLVHPELLTAVIQQQEEKIKKMQATIEKLKDRDWIGKVARVFKRK
jgi:SAM-dependent methyltransferase